MRVFWNAQYHLYQINQAALDPTVVVDVHEVTSCAALVGVTNSGATQEARKQIKYIIN